MDIIKIASEGDLRLRVTHGNEHFTYLVETASLRHASRYFDSLLHQDKFVEGRAVAAAHKDLKENGYLAGADFAELPEASVTDIGRVKVSTIQHLMADFLKILHGQHIAVVESSTNTPLKTNGKRPKSPSISQLANLAVVADRFDALPVTRQYAGKYCKLQEATSLSSSDTESRLRQRLLIGLLLEHSSWVSSNSSRLIVRGSTQWNPDTAADEHALWWDLPLGIEGMLKQTSLTAAHGNSYKLQMSPNMLHRVTDPPKAKFCIPAEELIFRRNCALETIQSVQDLFVNLYARPKSLQCKLGYDSSPQCDSFQLGEMIRFFRRIGTLHLAGTIHSSSESEQISYEGDITNLLALYGQCPSYQINAHHRHCGVKDRLCEIVKFISYRLGHGGRGIGISLDSWLNSRHESSWLRCKRPLVWFSLSPGAPSPVVFRYSSALARSIDWSNTEMDVRDMFMAVERDWSAILR